MRTLSTAVLLASMLALPSAGADSKLANRLAGTYGTGGKGAELGTALDVARYNWGLLCFGNVPATPEYIKDTVNGILAINPDYKLIVRLWPTNLGKINRNGKQEQVTFLDYLYDEKIKEALLNNLRQQVDCVMKNIAKPENVVGFCFQEELPVHFSDNLYMRKADDDIPAATRHFADRYTADTGKEMGRMDESVRRWWGLKFIEAMNGINAKIKEYSGGKPVYLYMMMGNIKTLDIHPEGESICKANLMPCHFSEFIKPSICDGIFLYPGDSWDFYVKLAEKNKWPFFSQLSYTGGMRLFSWPKTVEMVNVNSPMNQGFFNFVWLEDFRDWNADPGMPESESDQTEIPRKLRRIADELNVGMDIVERNLGPRIAAFYDTEAKSDGHFLLSIIITNSRDPSWFPCSPELAVLKNVKVRVTLPSGYLRTADSPILNQWLELGNLEAGAFKKILYWPFKEKGSLPIGKDRAFTVEITCDNAPPVKMLLDTPKSDWGYPMQYDVSASGKEMFVAIPEGHPFGSHTRTGLEIELKCVGEDCSFPAVSRGISHGKLQFNGCLRKGQTLKIFPDGKGELDGSDVSDRIYGTPIELGDYAVNLLTYTDSSQPARRARMQITLRLVDKCQKK